MDERLYQRAKELARRQGISLAELVRRSLMETVASQETDKPWMRLAGALSGQPEDSETVDQIVYDREQP